jgi:hypothetical protein
MRDYQPIKKEPSRKFVDMAVKTKSWQPVMRNGWIIKFSVYRSSYVLLTIISRHTGQCIVRHFKDEDEACSFINFITEMNAEESYDL